MAIPTHELEQMNLLLSQGTTIADIARRYPAYSYDEVYWNVNDYSVLGKKRSISNRLKWLKTAKPQEERLKLITEVKALVGEIYEQYKINGKKLSDIDKALHR